MIREIPALLEGIWPAVDPAVLSVVCIRTTHPKFLVFTGNPDKPTFVVEIGERERLERTAAVLQDLHPRLARTVPKSLVCAPWRDGQHVHVQTGLAGLPWFRIPQLCTTAADWRRLLERSLAVLRQFHTAIADVPAWRGSVAPAVEFSWILEQSADVLPLSDARRNRLHGWTKAMEDLGDIASCWQHGDFSLNNLLVGPTRIAVIDFDEFGQTMMPLYDEIGLALSVPLSQGNRCPLSLQECLQICVLPRAYRQRLTPAVPGLILYHLLSRIAACRALASRDVLRSHLIEWAIELLDNPNAFIGVERLFRLKAEATDVPA